MLTENEVIEAVCTHLIGQGYTIEQKLTTRERGVDIIAFNASLGHRCFIEAKGGTSARLGSKRYGKGFSSGQYKDHFAMAFLAAAREYGKNPGQPIKVAVALPDVGRCRTLVEEVRAVGRLFELSILLVDPQTCAVQELQFKE